MEIEVMNILTNPRVSLNLHLPYVGKALFDGLAR